MRETSVVEVNLSVVDRNLRLVRSIVGPSCGLCPIVKADAYGLGAPRIARRLVASGADMLAVYSAEQAAALTRLGLSAPVLVLMPVHDIRRSDELHRALATGRVHLVLHDESHADQLAALAQRLEVEIPVHMEIDTGMTRGGSPPEEALGMLHRLAQGGGLRLAGIFTHFSNPAGDAARTAAQLRQYEEILAQARDLLPPACVEHVASTASLLRHPRFHRAMVRFGLAWAGYGWEELDGTECIEAARGLEPAVTWSSRIVQVRHVAAGTPVGYGSTWRAPRPSVLGLVPVGYADGFPRALPGARGPAMVVVGDGPRGEAESAGPRDGVLGRRAVPVVGVVNMDQITIDLTDLVEPAGAVGAAGAAAAIGAGATIPVGVGTRVELISADPSAPNHLPRLAAASGTIPHELLCRIAPRVRRVYLGEEQNEPVLAMGGCTPTG